MKEKIKDILCNILFDNISVPKAADKIQHIIKQEHKEIIEALVNGWRNNLIKLEEEKFDLIAADITEFRNILYDLLPNHQFTYASGKWIML